MKQCGRDWRQRISDASESLAIRSLPVETPPKTNPTLVTMLSNRPDKHLFVRNVLALKCLRTANEQKTGTKVKKKKEDKFRGRNDRKRPKHESAFEEIAFEIAWTVARMSDEPSKEREREREREK
jgi:hypothetical protein